MDALRMADVPQGVSPAPLAEELAVIGRDNRLSGEPVEQPLDFLEDDFHVLGIGLPKFGDSGVRSAAQHFVKVHLRLLREQPSRFSEVRGVRLVVVDEEAFLGIRRRRLEGVVGHDPRRDGAQCVPILT